MTTPTGVVRAAVALVSLLAALAAVTWRQSRALETLEALDEARRDASVAQAELVELERAIQRLESRARVVLEARERLGMRMPDASEQMILPREGAS